MSRVQRFYPQLAVALPPRLGRGSIRRELRTSARSGLRPCVLGTGAQTASSVDAGARQANWSDAAAHLEQHLLL